MGMVPIGVQSAPLYPQLIALAARQCGVDGVGRREQGKGRMTAQGAMTLPAHSACSEGSLQPLPILVSLKL